MTTRLCGNGGSASIASHFSVDLSKNAKIKCINFNEANLLTCLSNDYGYEKWIEKALKIYGEQGDCLILISSIDIEDVALPDVPPTAKIVTPPPFCLVPPLDLY